MSTNINYTRLLKNNASATINKNKMSISSIITPISTIFTDFKDLYAGFPVVLLSSIPQGGVFFLVKKSLMEGSSYMYYI